MKELENINRILPNLNSRVEDPPLGSATQEKVQRVLADSFGQSSEFLNPLLFRSGKLVIFVEAPIWTTHIRHRQASLTVALRDENLHINEIKVKVLPVKPTPSQSKSKRPCTPAGAGTLNTISLTGLTVQNPKLKASLDKLRARLARG